tara:strand:- start:10158 stop:11585 length:1428 start_codon:yes stop_codon:yes gene_type:complete
MFNLGLKFAFAIGFSSLMMSPAQANELLKVYERALSQDMQLQAARHARDAQIEIRPQARSVLLPQINGSYGYQEQEEDGTEGFGGGANVPVDRESTQKGITVRLDQVLFDWAAFRQLAQSNDEVALARARYRRAEQDLLLRTAQTYFNALSASDNLRFSVAEKEAFERQLEQGRTRFEVGLAAITEIQEAQARYDLGVAQEITAQQQLANAREALYEITGRVESRLVPLIEEFPLQPAQPAQVEPWLETANANNLDLIAASLQLKSAEKGVSVARAGHLPTVGALAQYEDLEASGGRFSGQSEIETIGIQVQIPIFSGLATRSRVNQARATKAQLEAQLEGAERGVERQTRDAFLAVMSGVARVKALRQAVLSSSTALEASEIGLEVGTRTTVDVLNAQSALFSAQRDYARARYDYLLSVLALKAAAGTLDEGDLREVDSLLVAGSESESVGRPEPADDRQATECPRGLSCALSR